MTIEVTEKNFDTVVLNSKVPVMVDLWAPWCGPCRMAEPIMEEISDELSDKILVVKCNVDVNPMIASRYGIRNIPSVLFFKDGNVVGQAIGAMRKSDYLNKIQVIIQ